MPLRDHLPRESIVVDYHGESMLVSLHRNCLTGEHKDDDFLRGLLRHTTFTPTRYSMMNM
jgi:hypothetical protein